MRRGYMNRIYSNGSLVLSSATLSVCAGVEKKCFGAVIDGKEEDIFRFSPLVIRGDREEFLAWWAGRGSVVRLRKVVCSSSKPYLLLQQQSSDEVSIYLYLTGYWLGMNSMGRGLFGVRFRYTDSSSYRLTIFFYSIDSERNAIVTIIYWLNRRRPTKIVLSTDFVHTCDLVK
jgi:hypothetical protein